MIPVRFEFEVPVADVPPTDRNFKFTALVLEKSETRQGGPRTFCELRIDKRVGDEKFAVGSWFGRSLEELAARELLNHHAVAQNERAC